MMKRRGFIKKVSAAGMAPMMLNGLPISVMGNGLLQHLAASGTDNDKVMVLIQLHGGNDGLNTVVPLNQYSEYINLRPNIALSNTGSRSVLSLDDTLNDKKKLGLHPDMVGVKSLYDEGKVAIVNAVGYENMNLSHFRSRDIWWMGGGYEDRFRSGWVGRYLDTCFPGYPEAYPSAEMPDPLALEIGSNVSLLFHRESGIPGAIPINNPDQFYDLVQSVGIDPPVSVENTHYGVELKWILDIEEKSNQYAERLRDVFGKGTNSANVNYPEKYPFSSGGRFSTNYLASQLKLVSRLLSGGSKTKVFLVKIGGFDTHGNQVEADNSSMGTHAALLYHISSAVKAFQDDLKFLGLEDRVATATFSEFGRRAASNGSYGTDHGMAAPMFVFGKGVKPGIYGDNPDLSNLTRGNLTPQFDYRQIFTSMLQDWMGASHDALIQTKFDQFEDRKLDLFGKNITGINDFLNDRFRLNDCYPNPATNTTTFSYYINTSGYVSLNIYDIKGNMVKSIVDKRMPVGEHKIKIDLTTFKPGMYLYKIESGRLNTTKQLVVVH